MTIRRFIEVRLQVPGFHNWPDAPDEVAFLRTRHRHSFHIRVRAAVLHGDRQLEFVLLQQRVRGFLYERWLQNSTQGLEFGSLSCEMIAQVIAENVGACEVGVSEDGEFEGIVQLEG